MPSAERTPFPDFDGKLATALLEEGRAACCDSKRGSGEGSFPLGKEQGQERGEEEGMEEVGSRVGMKELVERGCCPLSASVGGLKEV